MSAVLTWFNLKFQAQGGDGVLQRIKRIVYDAKSTVVVSFIFCKSDNVEQWKAVITPSTRTGSRLWRYLLRFSL